MLVPLSFAAELFIVFMPVESQRSALRAACEKLRVCYLRCKARPYEAEITESLSLTEHYNTRVRLQTPSNLIRENEAPREPLEIKLINRWRA